MSRVVDDSEEIRGVYIPIEGNRLVLPNAAVAEVVSYTEPTVLSGTPDWFIGEIVWRRIPVPVISFERALGGSAMSLSTGHRARIAMFNTLNGVSNLPFIGVIAQSIPGLIRIKSENIVAVSDQGDANSLVLHEIMLQGEKGLIPNLDRLEEMVAEVMEKGGYAR
ncbi:MAG: chemotaxis protein CheW [Candidatus Polarisedimenticolaceae bacterium]|nr:chemotaxis protein CheW [Candidatus Polarisedimenticolaceae bacterium]